MSDPYARRHGETSLEWQLRTARQKANARDKGQPIVPAEVKRNYSQADVMHVETGTCAVTLRRRSISSLVRMHQTGRLDNAQYEAALRIARVAERIERDVGVRGSVGEHRVDCSNTARDKLVEYLGQVRDEATYNRWRRLIPLPRRMILDMILVDRPLATTARIHGKSWEDRGRYKGGRTLFIDALDLWIDLRERVGKEIDERDLVVAHARLARAA